jgi:hypothetical protein
VSASVLYMSMSLDGYIAGPNDEPGNPGGDGFDRLHDWFVTLDWGGDAACVVSGDEPSSGLPSGSTTPDFPWPQER